MKGASDGGGSHLSTDRGGPPHCLSRSVAEPIEPVGQRGDRDIVRCARGDPPVGGGLERALAADVRAGSLRLFPLSPRRMGILDVSLDTQLYDAASPGTASVPPAGLFPSTADL